MRVVLVHGFNVRDKGVRSVDRLAEHFPGWWDVDKDEADYGFFNLWKVRFARRGAIRRIAEALKTADAVVAHSNGCNYVMKALRFVPDSRRIKVFFLSPAVNRTTRFPKVVEKAIVLFTKADFWVFLSGFLPFHPWGWMGMLGPKGEDERVDARDFTDIVGSHSGWFKPDMAPFTAGIIILELENNNERTDS